MIQLSALLPYLRAVLASTSWKFPRVIAEHVGMSVITVVFLIALIGAGPWPSAFALMTLLGLYHVLLSTAVLRQLPSSTTVDASTVGMVRTALVTVPALAGFAGLLFWSFLLAFLLTTVLLLLAGFVAQSFLLNPPAKAAGNNRQTAENPQDGQDTIIVEEPAETAIPSARPARVTTPVTPAQRRGEQDDSGN